MKTASEMLKVSLEGDTTIVRKSIENDIQTAAINGKTYIANTGKLSNENINYFASLGYKVVIAFGYSISWG